MNAASNANVPADILIVDDTPENLQVLAGMLKAEGYKTRPVPSGELALLAADSHPPDLILLDVLMPGMDGYEVCQRLKANTHLKHIPVIFISALDATADKVRAFKVGGVDFITKPFQIDEVRARVETHLTLRRLRTELELQNRRLQEDLAVAREFQEALLPHAQIPPPPAAQGDLLSLEIRHVYKPTVSLGGDFFDLVKINEHQTGVMIADVMGHGTRSALITAIMRALLHEAAATAHDPGLFLSALNRHYYRLIQRTHQVVFVSAFYMVIDRQTGELSYSSAGHPSPMLADRTTRTVGPLYGKLQNNPALGLIPEARHTVMKRAIKPDDVLVLYTDGILEAPNAEREEFGADRLMATIRENLDGSLDGLTEGIARAAAEFSGEETLPDDVCVVAVGIFHSGRNSARLRRPETSADART